jgi:hypothetical protein
LTSVGVPIAFGSTRYFTANQNVGQVKSFQELDYWQTLDPAWREALYRTATQADQATLLDLLQQIPAEQTALRHKLHYWIINFNYDKIMALVEG